MNNIVCITSPTSVGCTFVDWSIHFLSGKNKFYSVKDSAWIPVSNNPIDKINAHGHKKNHPSGHDRSWEYVRNLETVSNSELLSFYPIPLFADYTAKVLGIKSLAPGLLEEITNYQKTDYTNMIDSFIAHGIKVVYMNINKHNVLYTQAPRSLDRLFFADNIPKNFTELKSHTQQLFFADSVEYWKRANLTDVWDLREREALCIRPFGTQESMVDVEINFTKPYLYIDSESMWYNGKNTIRKIMKFLKLSLIIFQINVKVQFGINLKIKVLSCCYFIILFRLTFFFLT